MKLTIDIINSVERLWCGHGTFDDYISYKAYIIARYIQGLLTAKERDDELTLAKEKFETGRFARVQTPEAAVDS